MDPLDTIRALALSFSGVRVYTSEMFPQRWDLRQVRFPKTKRKRIRKKWEKNPANWANVRADLPHFFFKPNGDVYCNQPGWDALQEMIDDQPKTDGPRRNRAPKNPFGGSPAVC